MVKRRLKRTLVPEVGRAKVSEKPNVLAPPIGTFGIWFHLYRPRDSSTGRGASSMEPRPLTHRFRTVGFV